MDDLSSLCALELQHWRIASRKNRGMSGIPRLRSGTSALLYLSVGRWSTTAGKVYVQNPASLVFTDDTTTYTARVQLPTMDLGSDRMKRWQDVSIIADTEITSSPITVSFSDDDYQTYHVHGTIDLNSTRKYANRFGSSRKRGWVLTHSAATPMRLEALELGVELGDR
jgi:hypothetical protein